MKTIGNILLVAGLIVLALWIKGKYFPTTQTVVQTQTVTDTVWNDTIVYKQLPAPKPDTIYLYDTVKIKMPPDSTIQMEYAKLYQKYHSQYFYHDTLKNDTNALIVFEETISKNKPFNRNLIYQNRVPTEINNTTVIENQRKYFLGVEAGVDVIKPQFIYKDLNDIQYQVGYDLIGPEKGIRFGISVSVGGLF